jgi:uncharacterized protein YigA (DUF484 family)
MKLRAKPADLEALVADYLQRHPDFFLRNADLLLELEIPHQTGPGVASLIERQVAMLRRKIQRLQQSLDQHEAREARNRGQLDSLRRALARLLELDEPAAAVQLLASLSGPTSAPTNCVCSCSAAKRTAAHQPDSSSWRATPS